MAFFLLGGLLFLLLALAWLLAQGALLNLGSFFRPAPKRPWYVSKPPLDLAGRHGAAIGSTGSGKSMALHALILATHEPVLVITLDRSDPTLAAVQACDGIVWSARGNLGLDILVGSVNDVTERLLSAWTVVSQGEVFRGVARVCVRETLNQMDQQGADRTLAELVKRLEARMASARGLEQQALAGWLARFRDLAESLGPALGHHLDLASALRAGETVLLECSAFRNPTSVRLFGSLLLSEAARCADEVGNFLCVVDEGAHASDSASLEALFRAGRARGVSVVFASQIVGDAGPTLKGNVECWWLGRQGPDGAAWCSRLTGLPAQVFSMRALRRCEAIVMGEGVLKRSDLLGGWWPRLKLALGLQPWPVPLPIADYQARQVYQPGTPGLTRVTPPAAACTTSVPAAETTPSSTSDAPPPMPPYLATGADPEQLRRIWQHHTFPPSAPETQGYAPGSGGCWLSTYRPNRPGPTGRPTCKYQGVEWTTYSLMLALHDGLDLADVKRRMKPRRLGGEDLTADHLCPNVTCDNPAHLRWLTRVGNVHAEWDKRLGLNLSPTVRDQLRDILGDDGG